MGLLPALAADTSTPAALCQRAVKQVVGVSSGLSARMVREDVNTLSNSVNNREFIVNPPSSVTPPCTSINWLEIDVNERGNSAAAAAEAIEQENDDPKNFKGQQNQPAMLLKRLVD